MERVAFVELNSTEVEIICFALTVMQDTAAAICKTGDIESLTTVTGLLRERLTALSSKLNE